MFREMHHMDRNMRAMDLTEKMVERRRQSLTAKQRPTIGARMTRMARMLLAPGESLQAEDRA